MIRMFSLTSDQEVADNALKQLEVKLDVYDQILSKQKYVAGDVSSTITVNSDPSEAGTTLFWVLAGNHPCRFIPPPLR